MFLGRVPLATDVLRYFAAFQSRDWSDVQTSHAEMGDSMTQFYPWRVFAAGLIRKRNLPLWNPFQLSGSPLAADGQSSQFYPPTWSYRS
jgi:hypothetical protein